ncbi:LPS translocon maturation chaperone LptM [Gulbenkiania mobilis]|nr:lipoprotein [Gulbenkiania mobilis]
MRRLALFALLATLLAGCGYKGPLYLPDTTPNASAAGQKAPTP